MSRDVSSTDPYSKPRWETTEFSERLRSARRVRRVELAGLRSPVRNRRSPRISEVPGLHHCRYLVVDVTDLVAVVLRSIFRFQPPQAAKFQLQGPTIASTSSSMRLLSAVSVVETQISTKGTPFCQHS